MWQCSSCGAANTGNVCRQCGLPAYRADAHFQDRFSADDNDLRSSQLSMPEATQAYRRPKRKSRAAQLWCLLALVLCALSFWQSLRPIYRFSLSIDTENMSQTLEGVLEYVNIDLTDELGMLQFSDTYSIRELYEPDGKVAQLAERIGALTTRVDEVLHYLQQYGYADAEGNIGTGGITRLLSRLTIAQTVVKAVFIGLGVLLLLALILLLCGKTGAAGGFVSLVALATAAFPLLACTLLSRAAEQLGQELRPIMTYGIGFHTSFALNGIGMAVIILSAAALVFVIFSRIAKALSR